MKSFINHQNEKITRFVSLKKRNTLQDCQLPGGVTSRPVVCFSIIIIIFIWTLSVEDVLCVYISKHVHIIIITRFNSIP